MHTLFVGFRGTNNASYRLVSQFRGEKFFLTNSFSGLTRDIEKLTDTYSAVFLFGIDKTLVNAVRIERCAEQYGQYISTVLPLDELVAKLHSHGVECTISDKPTHYLCNDAYFKLLEKYKCKVVLIHIPSIKNMRHTLFTKIIYSIEKSDTYDAKSHFL